jgi:hypothetical protein
MIASPFPVMAQALAGLVPVVKERTIALTSLEETLPRGIHLMNDGHEVSLVVVQSIGTARRSLSSNLVAPGQVVTLRKGPLDDGTHTIEVAGQQYMIMIDDAGVGIIQVGP